MITPTRAIQSGQRLTIRIAATVAREADNHGYTVDYMGARFTVPLKDVVAHIDGHMVMIEIAATVIKQTGIASFLMSHQGHELRIHEQNIVESEVS